MIGREAYQNPYSLAAFEAALIPGHRPAPSRLEVIRRFIPYVEARLEAGVPLKAMTRHLLGLFNGLPGARAWRRHLSEQAVAPGAGAEVIEAALSLVRDPDAMAAAA
jgi:tRNA-dihydrouridine synthase A